MKLFKKFFKKKIHRLITKYYTWEPVWFKHVGKKFIIITNEADYPPFVATFKGKEVMSHNGRISTYSYPIWKKEDGCICYCGGLSLPYSNELWEFIQTLNDGTEAWNLFFNMFIVRDEMQDLGYRSYQDLEVIEV
jgi:hypothetical protein